MFAKRGSSLQRRLALGQGFEDPKERFFGFAPGGVPHEKFSLSVPISKHKKVNMSSKCGTCCRNCTSFRSFTIIATCITLLGSLLLILWPRFFNSMLTHELTLTPDSRSYALWKDVPIPIYMEFYLFNWTNQEQIYDTTKKPIVKELGPYVFREHREKIIDGWFPHNSTVTYRQNRTWFFEPTLSNGSLDDLITTLNVPAVTAAYAVRDMSSAVKAGLDLIFFTLRTKHYVTKSVREFIFEGYKDPILDLSHFKPGSAPFDKFAWMYTRNGSANYDGVYNMHTDGDNLGILSNWNYHNTTTFYAPPCGDVGGSTGELFPPHETKGPVSIFSSDICRRLELDYKEEITVSGISGLRYWGSDRMFANETTEPNNWCFCGDNGDVCYPNGVLNVSNCKWGAPAFISFPHFYHADASYRQAVIGLNPQESRHQFFLDLEPETGIPLQVSAGFQINILLQPDKHYSFLKKVPRIFFPMIWFRQVAEIDATIGGQLHFILLLPKMITLLGYALISIGISILIILTIVFLTLKRRDEEGLYLVSQRPSQHSS